MYTCHVFQQFHCLLHILEKSHAYTCMYIYMQVIYRKLETTKSKTHEQHHVICKHGYFDCVLSNAEVFPNICALCFLLAIHTVIKLTNSAESRHFCLVLQWRRNSFSFPQSENSGCWFGIYSLYYSREPQCGGFLHKGMLNHINCFLCMY